MEKEKDKMNDIAEKARNEMWFLKLKSAVLWIMLLVALCVLGVYCYYISPHGAERNVKFQGSCTATLDSCMSHYTSSQNSVNAMNSSPKREDPSSKFNVSSRTEVNNGASCRIPSFKFSLVLAIGGFMLLFSVICCSLISTDQRRKELMKLYVTARHRQDAWEKGLELLGRCTGIANQKMLNVNQMNQVNSAGLNKPVLAMCADFKVVEMLLENLSDDPSKRVFM